MDLATPQNSTQACVAPAGYVTDNTDCNDDDSTVYPGTTEVCDGKDNDCNGSIDDNIKTIFYGDADGDGFGDASNSTQACTAPPGMLATTMIVMTMITQFILAQ
jgi:hypothetical protein